MAQRTPLPLDATLRSVAPTLQNREAFIAEAYKVIDRHERERGPVVLRIGVSVGAQGNRPNCRIDNAETSELVAVIDGNNHQPWTGDVISFSNEWSSKGMPQADVRDLRDEVQSRG